MVTPPGSCPAGSQAAAAPAASEKGLYASYALRRERAYQRLRTSGTHYVVNKIADMLPCFDEIEARLARGEKP